MAKSIDIDVETIRRLYELVLKQFPTDMNCLNALMSLLMGPILCNECGSADLHRIGDERHAHCKQCHRITWLTARTFLNSITKPRAYLMAFIYRGKGIAINAAELARVVGIANSTAQCILKKIDLVIQGLLPPTGILVDSRHFFECILRRSTDTPSKSRPVAEFDAIDKQNSNLKKRAARLKLSPDEDAIYKLLSDKPVSMDWLIDVSGLPVNKVAVALTMLELAYLTKACPGNNFVKCQPLPRSARKLNRRTKRILDANVDLMRTTYQGISRRYLQIYLGFCWSIKDRSKWSIKKLLAACAKFGPITDAQIAAYVSPNVVLLAALP